MVIKAGCKEIVDFMKKSNIYHLYARNTLQFPFDFNIRKSLQGRQAMLRMLLGALGPESIMDAFQWMRAPEDSSFWDEWDDELHNAFRGVKLKYKTVEKHD